MTKFHNVERCPRHRLHALPCPCCGPQPDHSFVTKVINAVNQIPSKAAVLKLQQAKRSLDVNNAWLHIARALVNATDLPVTIDAKLFGATAPVRWEVEQKLRDAGWTVDFKSDQRDGDYYAVS